MDAPRQLYLNFMSDIWASTRMFYMYFDHLLNFVEPDTGMSNCDINALTGLKCLCSNESLGGHIVTADFEIDGCPS